MKITKSDFVFLTDGKHRRCDLPHGSISRERWIKYIESHKDIFMWYEDTPEGKETIRNLNDVPEWAKERVLYSLDKASAYTISKKIVKKHYFLIFDYNQNKRYIRVHRETTITIPMVERILDMAAFLGAKVVVNGSKFLESIDQIE